MGKLNDKEAKIGLCYQLAVGGLGSQEPEQQSTVVRPKVSYDWYLILRWWHVNFIIVCPSIIQDYQKPHLKKNGGMHNRELQECFYYRYQLK